MKTALSEQEQSEEKREFEMTDEDFQFIVCLIRDRVGIAMSEVKRNLVYSRLTRRLRALGISRFSDYCKHLGANEDSELEHFINALTTNLTSFFREAKHFEFLENTLLPALLVRKRNKRLRIWSAGCSTGEEPYSLAISVAKVVPADWDARILATDVDSSVLRHAGEGAYDSSRVEQLTESQLRQWFLCGTGPNTGKVRVRPIVRDLVTFRRLNLMSSWPMQNPFDLIFCRNVVIYFDKDTQKLLFNRFAEQLQSDGHLFIGHSETLYKITDRFRLLGNTIYQRVQ